MTARPEDVIREALIFLDTDSDGHRIMESTAQDGLAALAALVDERNRLREALIAMVYVHPCNCGDGIPAGSCARCRSVTALGFDPALAASPGDKTPEASGPDEQEAGA